MSIGVSTPAPLVACPFCGKQVAANMLQQHIAFSHPKAYQPADEPADTSPGSGPSLPEMVPCPYCGIRFSKDTLDSHIATHHTYYCSVCGALYHSIEDLNAHVASVHADGKTGAGGGSGTGTSGGGGGGVTDPCEYVGDWGGYSGVWHSKSVGKYYRSKEACLVGDGAIGFPSDEAAAAETKEWKGYCFIATAAFGSDLAPELDRLRFVRDNYLPPWFVRFYYWVSPPIARFVSKYKLAASCVRAWIRLVLKAL